MLSNQGNYSHPRHSGLFRTKDEDRICKGAPDTCIALLCDTELEVLKKVIGNTEGEIRPPTLMKHKPCVNPRATLGIHLHPAKPSVGEREGRSF